MRSFVLSLVALFVLCGCVSAQCPNGNCAMSGYRTAFPQVIFSGPASYAPTAVSAGTCANGSCATATTYPLSSPGVAQGSVCGDAAAHRTRFHLFGRPHRR